MAQVILLIILVLWETLVPVFIWMPLDMHHPALGTALPNGSKTQQYSQNPIKSQDPNPIKYLWDVMEHIQFHGGPTMTQTWL